MAGEFGTWIFRQLGGERKVLRLEGWDAPSGRPRQHAVVEDGIEIRSKRNYYSGKAPPTRHIFGNQLDDYEISGRFMDRHGGPGYAQAKTEFVKAFVADAQLCSLSVGSALAVLGLLKRFKPGRESTAEIAWSMVFEVDEDDLLASASLRTKDVALPAPSAITDKLGELLAAAAVPSADQPPLFSGTLFDSLDSLIAGVTAPFATLANLAKSMSGFEQALIGDIRKFRAGLGQLKTALIIFRDTYQDFRSDLAMEGDSASEEIRFSQLQAVSGASTMEMLLLVAEADRAAAIAEQGRIIGVYDAKDGDTWEGISRQVYGAPDRANDIREANGIAPGVGPKAGAQYQIPV